MPVSRRMPSNLNMRALEALAEPGRYSCGNSLYLQVGATSKGWVFRYQRLNRAHEVGLGSFPAVTLAAARHAVLEVRRLIASGIDPLEARQAARAAAQPAVPADDEKFRETAEKHIAAQTPAWKNPKSGAQWRASLQRYAYPYIGDKPPREITTADMRAILDPIWSEKTVTAERVRGRIEAVLNAAKARDLRTGENVAQWRGHLALMLPSPARLHRVEHHAALSATELPAVMQKLTQADGIASSCVRFIALTAVRASNATQASWDEIDGATWTIPAERMKAGRVHRVPLAREVVALLRELRPRVARPGVLIFPGLRSRPLSLTALMKALRRAGGGEATVHGLRSTFRDWCAENGEDRELAEIALAHVVADATEAAYRRTDLLERRRPLMQKWATFAT